MKKLNILIQIFALSTFILSISIAQSEINFEKYSVKDGLSSSVVNSICQDSYGFLWIGTENGLNRFDGYNFKVYKHNPSDSTSIPGDNISSIIEDHDGNIWIAGFDAVAKFDRSTNKFISYSIEKYYSEPTNVTSIMEDSQNRIWIATNIFGIQLIDEHNKRFLIVGKTDNKINREWGNVCSITETNKGEIFAADYGQSSSLDSIRTQQGLYTFNEKNKTFELKNRLPKNISTSISNFVEDDFGNLWFSSNNKSQIFNFNPATNQIKSVALSIPSQSVITITTIFKDNDGYLWIGTTSGLIKYNPVSNKSVYYLNDNTNPNSISSNQVASIYQDSFGQLWIGTLDGGLNKVDLGKQPIHSYKLPHDKMRPIAIDAVSCITTSPDNDDVIWIGTMGNGLYSFNRKNGSFMFFRYDKNNKQSISGNNIFALTWDNSGNLWAATDSSLTKINVKTNEATRYLENLSGLDDGYLSANEIISDKTGKLWLATLHGVDIFIPQSGSIKRLPSIMNRMYDKKLLDEMLNVVQTSKPLESILRVGNLQNLTKDFEIKKLTKVLAVCLGEGRVGFNIETWGDHGWIEDENGNLVWGMNDVEKTFGIGGAFKNRLQVKALELKPGKYKLRFRSDQGYYYGQLSGSFRPPYDSLLWGIQLININDNQYNEFNNLLQKESIRKEAPMETVYSIEFSKALENVIWIGTNNKGLFKYNYKDDTYEQFKFDPEDANPINDVTKIVEDDYGNVWFTTPAGLGRLNPKDKKISFITDKDGLPANNVKSILIDNYKNVWVSSIVGISEIIRESENNIGSILNFTTQDGLQGFQFSFAAHKSNNGELFFGGNNGFNSFFPGRTNKVPPKIAITDFTVAAKSDNTENKISFSSQDINNIDEITLPFDQNDISIDFAPIHFAYPSRNKIYYKLDGINSDWVTDNRRFASFTNLDPGDYTFELKASNGDGIWNEERKSIRIIISPPWWRTTVAYIGYFLLFAGLVFGIDRVQRRRIVNKERNSAAIKEANLRAQIAETENERKTKELEEARQLQISMLPKDLPNLPNLDIAVYMKTATEVGGDYYDFHVHLDGTLTVVLGDATGHGMMSGMMVSIMKSLFMSDRTNKALKPFFENASAAIKDMQLGRLMMALTCVQIANNKIVTTNAGMPPLFIYRKNSQTIEEIVINNMPLGAMKEVIYDVEELKIESGDTILLMSDGFVELKNESKELYGYKRARNTFEEVAMREPEGIVKHLTEAGKHWTNNNEPEDDVTFVVIKVK